MYLEIFGHFASFLVLLVTWHSFSCPKAVHISRHAVLPKKNALQNDVISVSYSYHFWSFSIYRSHLKHIVAIFFNILSLKSTKMISQIHSSIIFLLFSIWLVAYKSYRFASFGSINTLMIFLSLVYHNGIFAYIPWAIFDW